MSRRASGPMADLIIEIGNRLSKFANDEIESLANCEAADYADYKFSCGKIEMAKEMRAILQEYYDEFVEGKERGE